MRQSGRRPGATPAGSGGAPGTETDGPAGREELRAFLKAFAAVTSFWFLEDLTGVGHETIRKFAERETEAPHERTLIAYRRLYDTWGERVKRVRESDAGGELPYLAELISLLPGRSADEAVEGVDAFLRQVEGRAEFAPWVPAVGRYLRKLARLKQGGGPGLYQRHREKHRP